MCVMHVEVAELLIMYSYCVLCYLSSKVVLEQFVQNYSMSRSRRRDSELYLCGQRL